MCMKRDVMGQTAIDGVEGLNRAGELGELGRFSRSRQLMWGHALYLIWWCIFFRPNAQVKGGALRVFGIACILVAAVASIVGVVLECFGISKLLMHAADFLFECIPSRVLCHDLLGESLAWSSPKTLRYCSIHMATNRYSLRFPCYGSRSSGSCFLISRSASAL